MLDLWREWALEETMSQIQSKTRIYPAFGKQEEGVPEGHGGCLSNHLQGLKVNDNVASNGDGRMTILPNQKSRPHGLFVIGFIGQCKLLWLVDTGAMRNILSYECYKRLPESLKFPFHEYGSQVFVADGRETTTYGSGRLLVKIGSQDVNISVLVADIEDSAILGMEFLSDVDGTIDFVQQQLVMNGEEIDLCGESCQQLSLRCITWRLVTIEPHCEAVIPVHLLRRQSSSSSESANKGLRILEPVAAVFEIKAFMLEEPAIVPVRILNTSDETQTIGAQSVVAVAKPVTGVTELEIPEANLQSINSPQQVEENCVDNLPEPLKGLSKRSTEQLTEDEGVAVADLLHQYKDVFSLSEHDLGRTNLIGHQIDTGNARPIK